MMILCTTEDRDNVDEFYAHISKEGGQLASELLRKKAELWPNAEDPLRYPWFRTAPTTRNLTAEDVGAGKRDVKVKVADIVDRDKRLNARKARDQKKLKLREQQEHRGTQGLSAGPLVPRYLVGLRPLRRMLHFQKSSSDAGFEISKQTTFSSDASGSSKHHF
ncbi:hypothetical protein ACEPAF_6009 [Sanghuangporus sanghuang]